MPVLIWLGRALVMLGGSILSGIVSSVTKKIAIIALVVSAISAFTVAFFAALLALVDTLVFALPNEFTAGLSLVIPSNAPLCIAAIFTAHIARWVYEWNVKVIQYRLS